MTNASRCKCRESVKRGKKNRVVNAFDGSTGYAQSYQQIGLSREVSGGGYGFVVRDRAMRNGHPGQGRQQVVSPLIRHRVCDSRAGEERDLAFERSRFCTGVSLAEVGHRGDLQPFACEPVVRGVEIKRRGDGLVADIREDQHESLSTAKVW